jgi:hypothetical protein
MHATGPPATAGAPAVTIATAIRADRSLDDRVIGRSTSHLTPCGVVFLRSARAAPPGFLRLPHDPAVAP